jgi:hypothetical protein
MLRALLLLALLIVCPARAQTGDVCTGQPIPAGATVAWDYNPLGPNVVCLDKTAPTIRTNVYGMVGWRYCRTQTRWGYQIAATRWSYLANTPELAADLLAAARNPDDTPTNDFARKHVNTPLNHPDLVAVWCPFRAEMKAGVPQSTAQVWRTPSTGSGTLYTIINGKRGNIIPGRTAAPNSLCTCSATPIVYLTATFCPLATGPLTEVTMCRQVAQ